MSGIPIDRDSAWDAYATAVGLHPHDVLRDEFYAGWDAAIAAALQAMEDNMIAHFLVEQDPYRKPEGKATA